MELAYLPLQYIETSYLFFTAVTSYVTISHSLQLYRRTTLQALETKFLLHFPVSFYFNSNGKTVAVFGGYSFCRGVQYKNTIRWRCSRNNICKVALSATIDGQVVCFPKLSHNHPPSKYCIHNGLYMRIGRSESS